MAKEHTIEIKFIDNDFAVDKLDAEQWLFCKAVKLNKYWSGQTAPKERHVEARLLWSDRFIYVRFIANQSESPIVNENPNLTSKTPNLWEKDVCEIFIAPDQNEAFRYFEFEVAPTGEWLDLGIHQILNHRETDWDYKSGMKTSALIETNRIIMAIKIPLTAFEIHPNKNDIWKGNLFRAVGKDKDRGYLAWQPTKTEVPNFHVPEKFGDMKFIK